MMDLQPKILFGWICLQVIFASVSSDIWKGEVVSPIDALVSSCVVLPCKFNYPGTPLPDSRIKGIWHTKPNGNDRIYDEDSTLIKDSFKGRTKLIGHLGEKNCSLEINDVRNHDNGPFCFRAEIPTIDKYSFVEECVTVNMKPEPGKPNLDHDESFAEGSIAIFKCYIIHTCPTHHPTIEWSRSDTKPRLSYKYNGHGIWEVESLLSFPALKEDDHTDITCFVTFHGNIKSELTHKIFIKRKENFLHIIIPVIAVFGTIIVFGAACFFVTKRYKKQIQELRSRNSTRSWSISRMSHRIRNYGRRQEPERSVGTKPNNSVSTTSGAAGFSKPRCPSPQSGKKSYNKSDGVCSDGYDTDYTNACDNVYGNI